MTARPTLASPVACVFDAYGTLFDVSRMVEPYRDRLGEKTALLAKLWREKQLQYTWLRSLMGAYVDFWHVTGEALDYALGVLGLDDPRLRALLMQLYLAPPLFDDVNATLTTLKAKGLRTAILSNGSTTMLTGAVNGHNLRGVLDLVISVDEAQIFKPHPSVYKLATDKLGVPAEKILFVSSNGWDAHAARHIGFHVAWVNRSDQLRETIPDPPDFEIRSLSDLPRLLGF
ncbi:MAG: haloacid dehalogenase type II [Alphaproteobacteria bacterium]|nr:haloacid dehalogenase type II [Alphaproteobacteria bacterium]